MRKIFLLLASTFFCTLAFSQDIVKLGNELLDAKNMTDAKFILVNNGMVMETLNGMIPDGRIIASNGSSIVCVVMPNNENKSMVASVLFISEENLEEHENNLRNSGYAFLEDGTYDSNGEARFYKIYQNDHKSCRISYPTNSDKTTRFEFTINRTVDASLPNIVALGDWLLTIDDISKSESIIVNNGMVLEPIELLGADPDLRILATNGADAKTPIMCTVQAISKHDKRISILSFVYHGDATHFEPDLRKLGYEFVDKGQYKEHIHTFLYSRYRKGNKYCRISYPSSGEKGASLEFVLNRNGN